MIMKWYIVGYDSHRGKGCPAYLKGDLNHSWEWNKYDPDPYKYSISDDYIFNARHSFLDFDFWDGGPLVSEKFVEICKGFGVEFRLVPVRMIQSGGGETKKKYFYMLFSGRYEILDYEASDLKFDTDLRTGAVRYHKYSPCTPFVYSVYKAVIDESKISGRHIFKCLDFSRDIVCSEVFKAECESSQLNGIRFIEIDDCYREIGNGDTDRPELETTA